MKLGATRPYLRDKTTGKKIWKPQPRSLMTAKDAAKRIAKKTGHVIEVVDDFGVYWTTKNVPQQNPRKAKLIPAKVLIGKNGKLRVFVSAGVARRLKRNPDTKAMADMAYQAGREWGKSGAANSGVANARVRRYGFIKWWNNQPPADTNGIRKGFLETQFYIGYKQGRGQHRSR